MAEEVVEVGRLTLPVEIDVRQAERDLRQINTAASAASRGHGAAMREGQRETETFSAHVHGAATATLGLAMILTNQMSSAWSGFTGWLKRGTVGLVDLGSRGVLYVSRGLRTMAEESRGANGELSVLGKTTVAAATGLEHAAKIALTLTGILTGLQIAAAAAAAAVLIASQRAASDFTPSWNRVRTLLDDSAVPVRTLRAEVSGLAGDIGMAGEEANATFYEILSAMPELIEDPARALDILGVSLEAGRTGFTSAADAAAATTAILNAFSKEAEDAREVSDALFATQDQGVTTFGEIASSIGRVADIAASLGADYRDILGIVATITPAGVETAEVMTQVRATLSNILRPSEQARAAAQDLGVDFSATAVKAKGLNGFLLELIETTEGDPEQLARFFGSQEALALVVSLARQTEVLTQKTDAIGASAGTTAAKVDEMNDGWQAQKDLLDQQLDDTLRQIGFRFEELGTQGLRAANTWLANWRELRDMWREMTESDLPELADRMNTERFNGGQPVLLPGVRVTSSRARPGSPIPRPEEPTSLEFSQDKIREQERLLRLRAAADHAATGNAEAYARATRAAQEQINRLVVSEMARLRAAGVEETQIAELASMYQVLGEQRSSAAETTRQRLEQQWTQAEEEMARGLAELSATIVDEALLALDKLEAAARETARKLGRAFPEEMAAGFEERRDAIRSMGRLQDLQASVREAQELPAGAGQIEELERILLLMQAEAELLPANSAVREAYNEAVSGTRKALDSAVTGLKAEAAQQRKNALEQIAEEKRRREEAHNRRLEELRDRQAMARGIAESVRSALDLANAFGAVSDNVGLVVNGVISAAESVVQITSSLDEIASARENGLSTLTGALGLLGGIGMGISAFTGIVGGLAASAEQRRQEALRAHIDSLQANYRLVRALDELRGAVLNEISVAEKERIEEEGRGFSDRFGMAERTGTFRFSPRPHDFLHELSEADFEFLSRLEELTGMEFFDQETLELNVDAFNEAWRIFQDMDVGQFAEDLQGRLDALDYAAQVAGDALGDAAARLEMFLDVVREFAPEFAAEFERILKEEGPAAARAWLEQQAILFAQGGAAALGAWAEGLTPAEIERIIQEGMEQLDGGGGVGGGGSAQTRLGVSITEVQANQLLAFQATQVYHLAGIHSILAGGRLPQVTPGMIPALPSTGGAQTTIDLSGLTVEVEIIRGPGDLHDRDGWRDAGRSIGDGVQESLAPQLARVARGVGRDRAELDTRRRRPT